MKKLAAKKTEWPDLRIIGNFIANREYSGEWQIHAGTTDDFFSCEDTWCDTFPTLRDAKEWVENYGESA